ncbi:MAG: hypothetical protein ACYDEQ_04440 [Desulfocucumaceae bacterium]
MEKASQLISAGNYFWNSGIFIWRVDLILRLINSHLPGLAEGLKNIAAAPANKKDQAIESVYKDFCGLRHTGKDQGLIDGPGGFWLG